MKNLMILIIVALMISSQHVFSQNTETRSIISVSVSNEEDNYTLTWATKKEVNSSYFLVERSEDQLNYIVIGRIKAAGYSVLSKNYRLEDFNSGSIFYYYRVMLVNMDGERICSSPVKALPGTENSMIADK